MSKIKKPRCRKHEPGDIGDVCRFCLADIERVECPACSGCGVTEDMDDCPECDGSGISRWRRVQP